MQRYNPLSILWPTVPGSISWPCSLSAMQHMSCQVVSLMQDPQCLVQFPSKLGTHCINLKGMKCWVTVAQCAARNRSNWEPVAWQTGTLTATLLTFLFYNPYLFFSSKRNWWYNLLCSEFFQLLRKNNKYFTQIILAMHYYI